MWYVCHIFSHHTHSCSCGNHRERMRSYVLSRETQKVGEKVILGVYRVLVHGELFCLSGVTEIYPMSVVSVLTVYVTSVYDGLGIPIDKNTY